MTRENSSVWQEEQEGLSLDPPSMRHSYEAAIIGGGMAGMLLAYSLLEAGIRSVAVLEADAVGRGQSGRSTAKITAQHGLIYDRLLGALGRAPATQYARANRQAIEAYHRLILRHDISCGFVRKNAYLYTRDPRKVPDLAAEAQAASALGLDARLEKNVLLPFRIAGALCFADQAQLDPVRLLHALARLVTEMGGHIFQHTEITSIQKNQVFFSGGSVLANHIALCTHYPLLNKAGLYFLRLYQSRSYVAAVQNAADPEGMYLDVRQGGLSFRTMESPRYGPLVLLGIGDHITGHEGKVPHYVGLETAARRLYPQSRIVCRWSAQDCMTYDGIPYIGRLTQDSRRLYVATGFNKWGFTGSMVAARLLTDLIIRGKSPIEEVFSPQRVNPELSAKQFITKSADSAINLTAGLLAPVKRKGMCLRCAHMGGALHLNQDEQSFDCPVHGSRFDEQGRVIEGPAVSPLKGSRPPNRSQEKGGL